MKNTLIGLAIAGFIGTILMLGFMGCRTPEEPKILIAPANPISPSPPIILENGKPPIVLPTPEYLKGYHDGYYGTWLAPFQWTFVAEYRNGWSAGEKDRKSKLPPKYPR